MEMVNQVNKPNSTVHSFYLLLWQILDKLHYTNKLDAMHTSKPHN